MVGKRKSGKRTKDGGSGGGEGSETGSSSDNPKDCVQTVKKMVGMYTPHRKGGPGGSNKTPSSILSRRGLGAPSSATSSGMGPPNSRLHPHTPKSVLRPGGGGGVGVTLFPALKEQDPIQVYCRVKPLLDPGESCLQIRSGTEVALLPPDNPVYWRQNQAKEGHYAFSTVFDPSVAQKKVFDEVALPLVADFVQGKNALLFAYGVTGSGKTFTMSGHSSDCGIMPRCLDVIFNSIAQYKATKYVFKPDRMNGFESQSKADAMHERQKEILEKSREAGRTGTPRSTPRSRTNDVDNFAARLRDDTAVPVKASDNYFSVFITHIEIYNNFVYDLLDESPIDVGRKGGVGGGSGLQSKMLREDISHNVYVNGVTEVEVESPADAFEVFQRGLRRRRIAHTALNTESSRSHSIFNIRLVRAPADSEGEEVTENKDYITISQLSLVDLAGSERYSRTQATGDRLKEAGNINNSLMTLRTCMDILRDNQQNGLNRVVPFRNSKLTHFLKNYFEGEGRVRMILCVNPRSEDYDENFHVLSFAEQAQEVQITRPQEKKIIVPEVTPSTPALREGRVRANELYKEAASQLVSEGVVGDGLLPPTDTTFVFHSLPIPICYVNKANEAEVLATLKKALEMRIRGQDELRKRINNEQEAFRQMLVALERENEMLKHENNSMKFKTQNLGEEKTKNETVLRSMMAERNRLESKYEAQDKLMKEMEEELADLRMQYRQRDVQHHKEKRLLKTDLELQRELDDLKRTRELKKEEEKLKAQFKHKENTLAKVRQLVSNVDIVPGRSSRSRSRRSVLEDSLSTSTSSEPDLTSLGVRSSRTDRTHKRAPSAPLLPIHDIGVGSGYSVQANVRKGMGIPATRRPRARSTDQDVWLEHVTGLATKEGTVMQPCMKKKKSVTQLTVVEDLADKASKYCLRTQEQDSEGEIETRLYKADVLSTVGGGAQVVFNDVEILRQESPTKNSPSSNANRKRRSSSGLLGGLVSSSPFRSAASNICRDNGDAHDGPPEETVGERCKKGIGSSASALHNSKRNRPT